MWKSWDFLAFETFAVKFLYCVMILDKQLVFNKVFTRAFVYRQSVIVESSPVLPLNPIFSFVLTLGVFEFLLSV